MKVSDKKAIVSEYLQRITNIKEKKASLKKHNEMRVRDNEEKIKVYEERKRSMMLHEEEGSMKKLARQKEVDKRQTFLKLTSSLNVI